MKFSLVSSVMFHKAIKDYNLKIKGSYSSQGYIEVYDADILVGESERGFTYTYKILHKYLINRSRNVKV